MRAREHVLAVVVAVAALTLAFAVRGVDVAPDPSVRAPGAPAAPRLPGAPSRGVGAGRDLAAVDVVAADFDEDGLTDLAFIATAVTPHVGIDRLAIAMGTAERGFRPPVSVPTPYRPRAVVACDADGDGHVDLAVMSAFGTLRLSFGSGHGTFERRRDIVLHRQSSDVACVDVDGDGKMDLVFPATPEDEAIPGRGPDQLGVVLGRDESFTPRYFRLDQPGPRQVLVADVNGDGHPDAVVVGTWTRGNTGVSVWLGVGDGTFSRGPRVPTILHPWSDTTVPLVAAMGDVDGDGRIDLVISGHAASGGLQVLLGGPDGSFAAPVGLPPSSGMLAEWPRLGDWDSDGRADIAVLGTDAVTVLTTSPGGAIAAGPALVVSVAADRVKGFDLDGDRRLDAVTLRVGVGVRLAADRP